MGHGPAIDPYAHLNLPVSKPIITFVILGLLGLIWLITELFGGSEDSRVLVQFGANYGWFILEGQTWRLFTSMFLHFGIGHLITNAFSLIILGLEMERLYGPDRYIIIYILAGLFGSLLSFAIRGPNVLSAGASGAIFGIVGMNLAFFLLNRRILGEFGRQRVIITAIIIIYNLYIGFTTPGIDNLAHLGGLFSGFILGYGLSPRYQVDSAYTFSRHIVDKTSLLKRWWVPVLAVIVLAISVPMAITFWLARLGGL